MKISFNPGTLVVLPVASLETIKRYAECLNGYACEITGKDAAACVSSVAHYDYEIEKISSTCFRIHKKTEHLARHVQEVIRRWQEADSQREVFTKAICLEHDAQIALDAANQFIGGSQGVDAGSFKDGYSFKSAGFTADLVFDENGTCTGFAQAPSSSSDAETQIEELKHIVSDLSSKLIEAQKAAAASEAEAKKAAPKTSTAKKTPRKPRASSKSKS